MPNGPLDGGRSLSSRISPWGNPAMHREEGNLFSHANVRGQFGWNALVLRNRGQPASRTGSPCQDVCFEVLSLRAWGRIALLLRRSPYRRAGEKHAALSRNISCFGGFRKIISPPGGGIPVGYRERLRNIPSGLGRMGAANRSSRLILCPSGLAHGRLSHRDRGTGSNSRLSMLIHIGIPEAS